MSRFAFFDSDCESDEEDDRLRARDGPQARVTIAHRPTLSSARREQRMTFSFADLGDDGDGGDSDRDDASLTGEELRQSSRPINTSFLFSKSTTSAAGASIRLPSSKVGMHPPPSAAAAASMTSFKSSPARHAPLRVAGRSTMATAASPRHKTQHTASVDDITALLQSVQVDHAQEAEKRFQLATQEIEQKAHSETATRLAQLQKNLRSTMDHQRRRKEAEDEQRRQVEAQEALKRQQALMQEKLERERREAEEREKAKKAQEEADRKKKHQQEKEEQEKRQKAEEADKLNRQKEQGAALQAVPGSGVPERTRMSVYLQGEKTLQELIETMKQRTLTMKNGAEHAEVYRKRMVIKRNVGQITSSRQTLLRIAQSLDVLFKEAQMHPRHKELYYSFLLNTTAKAFAAQSQSEIAVVPAKAFSYAHVAVLLYQNHPQFVDYMNARLHKKCPYLIPYYPQRAANQDSVQFERKVLRRRENETAALYTERMNGSVALWCAIIQTRPLSGRSNPYGIEHGWQWLARLLNLRPRSTTPEFVRTFLQIAGPAFLQRFPQQGPKLVAFIDSTYIAMCPKEAVAAATRLRMDLETYAKQGNRLAVMKESALTV